MISVSFTSPCLASRFHADLSARARYLARANRSFGFPASLCLTVRSKPQVLYLVAEIAAGEFEPQSADVETAIDRAVGPFRVHHFQSPLWNKPVATLRQRSNSASVFSLPGDLSCSQWVIIAR